MNKKVLITGGSRGIGRACAIKYAKSGYDVFFIYKDDTASAFETFNMMQKSYEDFYKDYIAKKIGNLLLQDSFVDNFSKDNFFDNESESAFEKSASNDFVYSDFEQNILTQGFVIKDFDCKKNLFEPKLTQGLQKLSTIKMPIEQTVIPIKCGIFKGDVGSAEFVDKVVDKLISSVGKIDILVSNAGISYNNLMQDCLEKDWKKVFDTNVFGTFNLCKSLLPHMICEKNGNIVTISSMWGVDGASCESIYAASKGAIIAFTKSLAKEVGISGIRCNCVCPGVVMTDMMSEFSSEDISCLMQNSSLNSISTPQDIANTVFFLTSSMASSYNGEILSPKCGYGQI